MLLVEVGAGVAAGVGVPSEVEDDGFSLDIETMVGKHALREEMEEIPGVAP